MLPLSISARGLSSCRLLGKLWPLPRIRREASTWTPSSFDPPRQIRAYYLNCKCQFGRPVGTDASVSTCIQCPPGTSCVL